MIVDDHPVVRDGLAAFFDHAPGFTTIALAADGAEAVRLFDLHRPDVTLMDVGAPAMDGITATRRILDNAPGAGIIILTRHDGEDSVWGGLRAGAEASLLKEPPMEKLAEVIHAVYNGGRRLRFEVASKPADRSCLTGLTEFAAAPVRTDKPAAMRTSKHRQRETLMSAPDFRERVMAATPFLIAIIDSKAKIVSTNRAAAEVYGGEIEDLIGRPFYDCVSPHDAAGVIEMFRTALADGLPAPRAECRVVRKDGGARTIRFSLQPLTLEAASGE